MKTNRKSGAFAPRMVLMPALPALMAMVMVSVSVASAPKRKPSRGEISKRISGEKPVTAGGVNRLSCVNLYEHQLKTAANDRRNSLSPAMRLHLRLMKSTATRKAQLNYCLKNVSRGNYDCQMKATDMLEILRCRRRFPLAGGGVVKKEPRPDPVKKEPVKKLPAVSFKVNAAGCSGAYEHLLRVYARSELLSKRGDAARLLRHWNSPGARKSFENRCRKEFRSENLRCIRTSTDPVVIQGCLANVGRG